VKSKVVDSFGEAVRDIPDGASILIPGFSGVGIAYNLLRALYDQGAKGLLLIGNSMFAAAREDVTTTGNLVEAGRVRKVIGAFSAAGHPSRRTKIETMHEAGEIEAELVAQGTLAERIRAGGAGIPAFYTPAAIGTELAEGKEHRLFNGRTYLMEEAITADYALLRAWKADEAGNLVFRRSARNFNPIMATAARCTIAEVEELVPAGELDPDQIHTPGIYVHRVIKIPPDGVLHARPQTPPAAAPAPAEASSAPVDQAAKRRLTRVEMAKRLASEFQDGWIVNLGLGMPTMCSDHVPAGREVIFHSENGIIGYGRHAVGDEISPYLVNAGGETVILEPGGAIVHHADSFGVVRSGRIDAAVLGAYEVGANGDVANWKLAGAKGGGIGGAMDIAACSKQVFVIMEHTTRDGEPRLLPRCSLPITAPGCVTRVMTDLGLFEPNGDGFRLLEIAPGYTLEEVQALTGAPVVADAQIKRATI